jgi:protein subunit release factor B
LLTGAVSGDDPVNNEASSDSGISEDLLHSIERDCTVEFTRGSGPGGQHRNKAETAVRLTHIPSGLVVVAADSRSQAQNRKNALRRLAERLIQIEREEAAAKKRSQRKAIRPSASQQRKRLELKKQKSRKKESRRKVKPADDDI